MRLLVRYFRGVAKLDSLHPRINLQRDLEVLRLYWALSSSVEDLLSYLTRNRHEIQAVLATREIADDARVRGRLNARASIVRQAVTGHPTLHVVDEPERSFLTGPNQVLCWTLDYVTRLLRRLEPNLPLDSPQRARWAVRFQAVDEIRRMHPINAVLEVGGSRRPSSAALVAATRSRRPLYRLAAAACRELTEIERGTEAALRRVLGEAVLVPLYPWQRYELAVGLAIAEAVSRASGEELGLSFIGGEVPIATIGPMALWWQHKTDLYSSPIPEPSESLEREILSSYGVSMAHDRPDLIVVDTRRRVAVAVVEVKCSTAYEGEFDVVRAAVAQVVRYSRGYATGDALGALLSRSMVALLGSALVFLPRPLSAVPFLLDFDALQGPSVDTWASRIVHGDLPATA